MENDARMQTALHNDVETIPDILTKALHERNKVLKDSSGRFLSPSLVMCHTL